MADPSKTPGPEIVAKVERSGSAYLSLRIDGHSVSGLGIYPYTLRVGAATVRMDGIGGVGTDETHRNRGYARQVLDAAVERMQQGDAALSMLYGIPNFYHKFGYVTAGPDHSVRLTRLAPGVELPAGWWVRPFVAADLGAVQRLYEQSTARATGAAVRTTDAPVWSRLLESARGSGPDTCRVVEDPDGRVAAYAWLGRWHWAVDGREGDNPDALVIGEVMAGGPAAADALLAACRAWAVEDSVRRAQPVKQALLALPPEGPVAAAAARLHATFEQRYSPNSGSMVRVLDVARLLESLRPEFAERLRAAGSPRFGALQFRTDLGSAILTATPDGLAVERAQGPGSRAAPESTAGGASAGDGTERVVLRLPQTTLARLALGAFPPEDLLARLETPPNETVRQLLAILFPLRHPHMHLPDRF